MNKRFWLWLLLLLLLSPPTASAQNKQSHYSLPDGLNVAETQELMAQRFQELQELHQLQDQLQDLLKDRKFIDDIRKNFKESDLQRLREKMLKGEGLSRDSNWPKLLEQAAQRKNWTQAQIDMLHRWAERAEPKLPPPDSGARMFNDTDKVPPTPPSPSSQGVMPPPSSLPPPAQPDKSSFERFQVKTTQWLLERLDDVGGDMLQSITEMGGMDGNSPLAELLRSVPQSDFSGININENPLVPALGSDMFSRYASNVGDFLRRQSGIWDGMGSLFREAPLPSLSRIGGPSVSMRAAPSADGESLLPVMLSLLMLAVIILLVYKRGFGSKSPLDSGEDAEWRLGSWPVSPGAVSTRQDVVRAFEYLALLCFGPDAAACHHHQLAQRLAEAPPYPPHSGGGRGGAGRRQAAEMLAWLYEQARYAPAGEALSPEQLSDARQALCLLAGVTAA